MKIKTIVENTPEVFDEAVNEFESEHKVKFTQTQHSTDVVDGSRYIMYRATIFYEED